MPQYKISTLYPQKRALITNAGSGLGKALSLLLAKDGWTIGMTELNIDKLTATAKETISAGGHALPYLLDIGDISQYEEMSKKYLAATGGIDLLINNTGVTESSVFGDFSIDDWQRLLAVHQTSAIYGAHFFLAAMLRQTGKGHVINIAACDKRKNHATMAPYMMAMRSIISLSETIKAKFASENIGISVATPDIFDSPQIPAMGSSATPFAVNESLYSATAHQVIEAAAEDRYTPGKNWWQRLLAD